MSASPLLSPHWIVVATVGALGCATVGMMRTMPFDEGIERRFNADLETVVIASRNAVVATGLAVVEFEKVGDSMWSMIATAELYDSGELVRVVCERVTAEIVAVRVTTRRREPLRRVVKGDWSGVILSQIDAELRLYSRAGYGAKP